MAERFRWDRDGFVMCDKTDGEPAARVERHIAETNPDLDWKSCASSR
jgi:hypothetical protein